MDPRQTRGFLNNNPGNMDRGEPPWNGEVRDAGGGFAAGVGAMRPPVERNFTRRVAGAQPSIRQRRPA